MRMYKPQTAVVFILFWNVFFPQQAPKHEVISNDLYFHLINVRSGLSNNVINDVVQDSLGFLWIGTDDGLNRFDGTNFKTFKKNVRHKDAGLANNYVQSLVLKNGNELLVGTDEGLNIYDIRYDRLDLVDHNDGLLNNSVSSLVLTGTEEVIVGTYRGGIQFLDSDYHFSKTESSVNQTISSDEISSMTLQGDSVLWVGTFNNGLNKIDYKKGTVTKILDEENSFLPSSAINSLYTDSRENLWVGTRKGMGIITRNGDSIHLAKAYSAEKGLSDNDVLCFEEDNNFRMWIGTRNGGLNIIDIPTLPEADHPLKNRWYLPAGDGSSVYNRTVSSIMMDNSGKMWIGTPTGLNYVDPGGELVNVIRHNEAMRESISHNRIGALERTKDGKIWIGTDGGGLDLFDPESRAYTHFKHNEHDNTSLSNNYILSILQDSRNRVWVGTYRGGINLMVPGEDGFAHYLQGMPENGSDVRVIHEGKNKVIWAGTNQGGLYRYDEFSEAFQFVDALGKIDIRDIGEDKNGDLWLATFGSGIIRYDPETNTSESFYSDGLKNIPSNIFFCILPVNENEILAGTRYGGLVRLDPQSHSIINITEKDGLSNNSITGLVAENENYVWLSTFNGLNRYDLRTHEVLDISGLDNILEGGFNIGAITRSSGGMIYVGGNNGVNYFDPAGFSKLGQDYPLIFEELRVLNRKVNISDEKQGVLDQSLAFQDEIKLKHDQNTFSVDFVALKYPLANNNITYSYKLENYNDFWIDTRGPGTANFTNVSPGKYELKIKTNSPYNGKVIKSLFITVTPPFWKTGPAYILYVLVIGLITWVSVSYYTERLKLKNSLVFEKKQRQLEHDLNEERLRFFTGFSHELKTPLTLILAPVDNLLGKVKQKELIENLFFIKRNAQTLYNSIDKLLEFRKTEEGLSQLAIGQYNIGKKVYKWVENYRPLAKDKKIDLRASVAEPEKPFKCDIEKIEVVFNNLLSNAIKYCKWKGTVKVVLFYEENYLKIKVSNTGSGINEQEVDQIFNWYYRAENSIRKNGTGIGLALSKRFAELHQGHITVKSKKNETTEFTLCLPRTVVYENYAADAIDTKTPEPEEFVACNEPPEISKNEEKIIDSSDRRDVILLIDDNPEILKFLDSILKSEFDLIHASDGEDGVAKAIRYVPNLIISDIMMPFKDGIDLCSTLKNKTATSHIPIVLLTAKSNTESVNTGFEEGADAYMTKPFNPKVLKTRVKNLLENRMKLRHYFFNSFHQADTKLTVDNHSRILEKEKEFLKKMEALILHQSGKDKVNTALLIKEIGMSRTSLYRKIKALTGQSINEFVREVKLKRAADLIRNESYSVSQASYEVGFNSIKYFRKIFKEKYGTTPLRFRSGDRDC